MTSHPALFHRLAQRVLLCAALLAVPLASGKKPASRELPGDDYGSVVALSPFEVTAESMDFDKWLKVTSPHFVVYTDAKLKEALLLGKQMEMLHEAVQFFLRRKALNLSPLIVVLPTARSDWRKIGNRGDVEWQVATSLVGSSRKLLLAEHDWQEDGRGSLWAMIGVHEVASMNLPRPLWFTEGMGAFFGTVVINGDTLTIGKQGAAGIRIRRHGWMEWPKFFSVTSQSPAYVKDGRERDQFGGQAAVFVHYLLTNPEPVWAQRLLAWLAYLDADNPPTEQGFKEVFEHDWKAWEGRLDAILKGETYNTGTIRFPPAALQFKIDSVKPSPSEMRELFVLAQIMNQATKESQASLDTLLARGLKTDSLREILADACARWDRKEPRLDVLSTLIAEGSTNPGVYVDAARVLIKENMEKPSLDTRLGDEVAEIRVWCTRAREIEPRHRGACEILAWAEAFAPTVDERSVQTIAGICRALDGHAPTDNALAALAMARWRLGTTQQARALAERLATSAYSGSEAKQIAGDLLARLGPPAAASSSPAVSSPVAAP